MDGKGKGKTGGGIEMRGERAARVGHVVEGEGEVAKTAKGKDGGEKRR